MQLKDGKRFFGGMNADDSPIKIPEGDYPPILNWRTHGSDTQQEEGPAETLQSEIEILLNPDAAIIYYGEAIGGEFIYSGYEEVQVGTQVWMKKNWDYDYPGSKVYDDDEDNEGVYGRLYNHNQVMSSDFCPTGWHVPTEAEFDTLLTYLGGLMLAGGKMKEVGTSHWTTPNTGATDNYGFRAIPGGKFDDVFSLLGLNCLLWIQDEGVPSAPIVLNGSNITSVSFIANWKAVTGVTGYYLDVATDIGFTAFVAGYNNKDVGNVLTYLITGLNITTDYFYRVRAYNEIGSSENSEISSIKTTISTLKDIDGNIYTTIVIGVQEWIIENLRTTKYADGTPIPNLILNADWIAEDGTPGHNGGYCWYNNNSGNKNPYGAIYNSYAVENAHGLAYFERDGVVEAGWRIPTIADFNTLVAFLGGIAAFGVKIKEAGFDHWLPTNDGTNVSGFTLVGAGIRNTGTGTFDYWQDIAGLWGTDTSFMSVECADGSAAVVGYSPARQGLSVRCVR